MNMKKIFNIITILLLTVFTTSCLDSNLEDLDTYKGKDIIGIAGVYHRYYGSQTIPVIFRRMQKQEQVLLNASFPAISRLKKDLNSRCQM